MSPAATFAVAAAVVVMSGVALLRTSWLQRRIVFYPEVLGDDVTLRFSRPHDELYFDSGTGSRLHAVRFGAPAPEGKSRAILYLHGNAGSVRSWGEVGAMLHARLAAAGRDDVVYVLDYAGYGRSRGILDEATLLSDVLAVWDAIAVEHQEVVVFGRSIGTGPATWLARERRPRLLILETPYASLLDLADRLMPLVPGWLLAFRFPTDQWMKDVVCPVHILHGTDDEVIPLASARRLIDGRLPPGSSVTIIEGGHHNDLDAWPAWARTVQKVLIDDEVVQ